MAKLEKAIIYFSGVSMPSFLFQPYKIGSLELKNRFVRSATWDGTADDSGAVTDTSVVLYRELGRGGVGLIVTAYSFVTAVGQAAPGQYGIHTDDMIPGLKRLVGAVHAGGARIAIQIVHAGVNSRYFNGKGVELPAVSKLERISTPHREMTGEEIEVLIGEYIAAVLRAREAGFDAVQFHGAHGYGMNQFLSPLFNIRTDRWGGSAENRRRFHLELIRRARQAAGTDYPLLIKFGVQDDEEGGLSLADGVETARKMEEEGIDAIEVSSGVGTSARISRRGAPEQAYYRDRAAAVKKVVKVPVMAVGGIRSLEMAEDIVNSSDADLISMCRPFIRQPDIISRWQRGETEPATCISCNKCFGVLNKGEPLECGEDRRLRRKAASGG
jgi:2,4-dienoyl-CoA reductase-like NADH-dependent reductase (Old Yellow Enzyme family)